MSACQASLGLDNKSNNGENLNASMQIEATRKKRKDFATRIRFDRVEILLSTARYAGQIY
ncbi:hypothetical protein CUJ88_19435 [Paraburkholderia hospita]|nr:hypothetical protein CUJ88_19435 [Paraburkholderia hospita]